jgi:hypothetical protein
MPYHLAGIDVHKKMLAVVVADVAVERSKSRVPRSSVSPGAQSRDVAST